VDERTNNYFVPLTIHSSGVLDGHS